MMDFLTFVTGADRVAPVPYQPEEIVINCMQRGGDEHGWHWDDYAYSLLWIVKAPQCGNGGEVQFVADTVWDKRNPQIEHYLATRPVESHYLPTGSAYLIRGNTNLHRVSPIKNDDTRVIICFSYAREEELSMDITHETMEELYPEARVS